MTAIKPAAWAMGAALLLAASLVAWVAWGTGEPAQGADHADAPGLAGDPAADIADIYAFRSAENSDNLVAVMTVNPLTPPTEPDTTFATDVNYNLHIDNTGDLVADATATITFSGDPLMFTVTGLGAAITGPVTTPSDTTAQVTESGGIKVFAGMRDDPFFFDLVGFQNFTAGPFVPDAGLRPAGETPSDTLAGTNVSAIVIELPVTAVTGGSDSTSGTIRVWASTNRSGTQVDRMAIPTVNTAVIPSGQKDAYNAGTPATDEAQFRSAVEGQVQGLRDAVDPVLGAQDGGPLGDLSAAEVAAVLNPDVVTIDFSSTLAFPNGRQLTDDVIDAALGIVLNRGGAAGVSDAIDANDKAFSNSFPYLAEPHTTGGTGDGQINGALPASGFGLVTFGGTIAQLEAALVSLDCEAPIFATSGGAFIVYIPNTSVTIVNQAFLALYPGGVIPNGTPLLGGNCAG